MAEEQIVQGVHGYSEADSYIWPDDPVIRKQLEWFSGQKLGLMIHWGAYSQLGVVESWALSDADAEWSREGIDWTADAEELKRQYVDLNKSFNPVRFEPEKWAQAAADGGFRYCVFTTKHHDGFCMWDTAETDYKVTDPSCSFHTHKYADICKHLFAALRKKGIGVVAYFSKADWHIDSYWQKDKKSARGVGYNPEENPEQWERFVQFVHRQVKELVLSYGRLEGLWFDAGWVCRQNGEDIRIEQMMEAVRKTQPWLLSADRTVGGICENYVTPEQCVPDEALLIPWESCITLGTSFSFRYEDTYKPAREVAALLVDVVAKGGNLALNVGAQPDGRLPEGALAVMKELGDWLAVYGEAIYDTEVCRPYKKNGIAFTQKKKENLVYAFQMYEEDMDKRQELFIPYQERVVSVYSIGTEREIPFRRTDGGLILMEEESGKENQIGRVFRMHIQAGGE